MSSSSGWGRNGRAGRRERPRPSTRGIGRSRASLTGYRNEEETMTTETGQGFMLNRRRLLTLTATGVSAAALGAFSGVRSARAADTIRWVSPRGTIEVLDDYAYW